jgi:hypothetical protein
MEPKTITLPISQWQVLLEARNAPLGAAAPALSAAWAALSEAVYGPPATATP